MTADPVGARAARLLRPAHGTRSVPAEPAPRALRYAATFAPLLLAGILGVASGVPSVALAQSGESDPRKMTVEELERHIEEQKAALERVRENRDITAEKAREVREALAEREARREKTEAELETLCRERDEVEPGTYEECAAQIGG